MSRRLSLSVGMLCAGFSLQTIASDTAQVIGEAYSLDDQKLLYTEQHLWTSEHQRLVRYISPTGNLIAKKQVDYQASRVSPNVEQVNELAGELVRVTRLDNGKTQIDYRETEKSRIKSETLRTPAQQVVDAGFDEYVLANWEALLAGKVLTMDFVAPSRQTHVSFSVKQRACEATPAQEDKRLVCFQIKPKGFIYRLALDPINLTYQRDTRRLQRFTGMGNIADESGDYMNVDIRYQYRDDQNQATVERDDTQTAPTYSETNNAD